MKDQEFIQGSSTGAGLVHVDLCTSPLSEMQDQQFSQRSSTGTGLGSVFLGRIDLCTPSPSP
jgi:hypothetical protein